MMPLGQISFGPDQSPGGCTGVSCGVLGSGRAVRGAACGRPGPPCGAGVGARGIRLRAPRSPRTSACLGGFSLVEVLVAVIVLAVGLLGMAGLQMSALRTTESARYRTLATQATLDLIDRLRADPAAVLNLNGVSVVLAANTCASTPSARWQRDFCAYGLPVPVVAKKEESEESEESEEEKEQKEEALKRKSAAVVIDCANSSTSSGCGRGNCEITVRWEDTRAEAGRGADRRNAAFTVCTRLPVL